MKPHLLEPLEIAEDSFHDNEKERDREREKDTTMSMTMTMTMSMSLSPPSLFKAFSPLQGMRKQSGLLDPLGNYGVESPVYVNLGCNRPLEIINARADARTRLRTQATMRKCQSAERLMELVSRQMQERNGREEKRLLASNSAERRRLWLKVIGISNAFVFLVKDLQLQLEEDKVLTLEKKSCAIIVRILSKNRRERKEEKRIRILFVMRNFTFIFRRLVSPRVHLTVCSCSVIYPYWDLLLSAILSYATIDLDSLSYSPPLLCYTLCVCLAPIADQAVALQEGGEQDRGSPHLLQILYRSTGAK